MGTELLQQRIKHLVEHGELHPDGTPVTRGDWRRWAAAIVVMQAVDILVTYLCR